MRRAARADANQPEIVKAIRDLGATWQHTHTIGGALDGIIGYYGIDQRVEIKDGKKTTSERKLTNDEQKVFDLWKGRKPVVIESVDDVEKILKQMYMEAMARYE